MSPFQSALSRLEFQFGVDAFRFEALDQTVSASGIASAVGEMEQLRERSPSFFQRFDYEWAFDTSSYSDPLSAQYQFFVLEILCEIDPSHPSYPNASGVVVRFLPTASIAPHYREIEGFHFILLPTTFLKILQEFALMVLKLRAITAASGPTTLQSDHFFGASIERKLRYLPDQALPQVDRFLLTLLEYARFKEPWIPHVSVVAEFNVFDSKFPQADHDVLELYQMCEMFAICHELAHILEHREQDFQRNLLLELEADRSASSLLVIHNSRHLLHRHGLVLGPIAFFQLMRAAVLVRRIAPLLDEARNADGRIDDAVNQLSIASLHDEYELKTRADLYEHYLVNWGFEPLIGSTYRELLHELYLPIAAIQHRLLTLIGAQNPDWSTLLQ